MVSSSTPIGFARVFGEAAIVTSPRITVGTALLGDFSTVVLKIRDDMSTVAFFQHGDLAAHNAAVLRAEHRIGVQIMRPNSLGKVALAA